METELENLVEEKISEGLNSPNDIYNICLNCLKGYFNDVRLIQDDSYYGNSFVEFKLIYQVEDKGEENKVYFFIDYHWKEDFLELLSIQFI